MHTHKHTPYGFLFYEGLSSHKIISESPEPPVKLWIIGSDTLQKPCAQVKDNLLPTQFNALLLCAHPDMWGRSWHHHWHFQWLLMSSAIRVKNRGLFTALPTQFSSAHSLITIRVIHPSDCNLSINPGPRHAPESLECSCITPVSGSFSDSSSNLHPPLWGCPVTPPSTTRLSALLTPCPCSLALCRRATPRKLQVPLWASLLPCPRPYPGVCPCPSLERLCAKVWEGA